MRAETTVSADPVAEVRAWLEEHWDPDLTVAEWWERLGTAGWSAPMLPAGAYGKDLSRSDSVAVQREIGAFGALGPPSGLGLLLAAPTIATHGTREQIDTHVRDIVTGQKAWCQLFSEPGAGSDLAGLTTRAVRDGDEWIVNGQKVWTSLGHNADLGMLIARTDPEVPKHQGITWFAIEMDQPGVEVRPLIEMTGHAMFNEVFLTDARVSHDDVIGGVNAGWGAANTTLQAERSGLGAGGGGAGLGAMPGTKGGQLERRVGDLVPSREQREAERAAREKAEREKAAEATAADTEAATANGEAPKTKLDRKRLPGSEGMLADLARANGKVDDPTIRQDLVRLHILNTVATLNGLRHKAVKAAGGDIAGMANIAKLQMSDVVRLGRDLGLRILGPAGTLHGYTAEQTASLNEATGNPMLAMVTGQALYAQAPPIYGGTDQIQRNIIGERVLGLPKEPGDTKNVPFSELPKNS